MKNRLPATNEKKNPPRDAAEQIRALAADGWSMKGVANKMGASWPTFRGWLDSDASLQEAFDLGREIEHSTLYNVLLTIATAGKTEKDRLTAAIMLLNARHNYRTGVDETGTPRINLVFNLPGALTPEQYMAAMKVVGNG